MITQKQLENARYLIELEEIQINRYRDLTRSTIETILSYKDFTKLTLNDQNDLEESIKIFDDYFPDAQPYFTKEEEKVFKEIIKFLKNKQNITTNDLRKIPVRAVLENSSRVYVHSMRWYALMKYIHELVINQVNESNQIWREGIKSANTIVEVDLNKYPSGLISLAKNYITLLGILGNQALFMLEKTDNYVKELNRFKNNIASETAFD